MHPRYGKPIQRKDKQLSLIDIPAVYRSRLPVGTVRNTFDWRKRQELHSCFTCWSDFQRGLRLLSKPLVLQISRSWTQNLASHSQDGQAAEIGNNDATDPQFLPGKNKVMPLGKGRSASQNWERYYDDELLSQARHQERYLLDLFPEFLPDEFPKA